jgi:hypothetical protein
MTWNEIRARHADQWLVVEAMDLTTGLDGRCLINDMSLVELCDSGAAAFAAYRRHHSKNPDRAFFFLHTSRPELDITEERWLGVRIPLAA